MLDNKGQVSFEYLMIFAISLVILVVFTLPLAQMTIETTFDVSDSVNIKADLSKIASAINEVYSQGQGARQEISIDSSRNVNLKVTQSSISCSLKLNDNSNKLIKQPYNSKLKQSSIPLKRGMNTVVVEWPIGNENMIIYKK